MTFEAELAETRRLLASCMATLERITSPIEVKAYKPAEVAEVLRVDKSIVYDMMRTGDLPHIVLPTMREKRIPAAAVDALVASERWIA